MTERWSGESRPDNRSEHDGVRFAGRCRECTAGLLLPGDDMQTVSSYDLAFSREVLRHYPQESWWWREESANDLRQAAYEDFDPFELSLLADEIRVRAADIVPSAKRTTANNQIWWIGTVRMFDSPHPSVGSMERSTSLRLRLSGSDVAQRR
jgi:hypothetical protein